ncbi:MAG: hypothetical protein WC763_00365 [Candidatus Paceibacterota bacterium]
MKLNIGAKPATWKEWMDRWETPGLSLYEQLGLLHHGYEIKIDESDEDTSAKRLAFYLEVADQTGLSDEELKAGGETLSLKARSMLVNMVISRESGNSSDRGLLFKDPHRFILLPLLRNLLCNTNRTHRRNWVFRASGPDHIDVELSRWSMVFLGWVTDDNNRNVWKDIVPNLREDVMFTAFIEAPTELWKKVRHGGKGGFVVDDLRKIIVRLGVGGLSFDEELPPERSWELFIKVSSLCKAEIKTAVESLIVCRGVLGPLTHYDSLVLMATKVYQDHPAS